MSVGNMPTVKLISDGTVTTQVEPIGDVHTFEAIKDLAQPEIKSVLDPRIFRVGDGFQISDGLPVPPQADVTQSTMDKLSWLQFKDKFFWFVGSIAIGLILSHYFFKKQRGRK